MASLDVLKNQAMNRRTYDGCKTSDDLRVTTGPGRYQLDPPPMYCDATYAPEPTTRTHDADAKMGRFAELAVYQDRC
jgi:hypothetical protein